MRILYFSLPLIAVVLCGCPAPDRSTSDAGQARVTVKGSDTMVHLVTAWAEAYMQANPEAEISVTGGGSGTGIAAMINGTTEICMASRTMKPKEIELAKKQGAAPVCTIVARDGIAVCVHPDNPVSELSLDQLRQIFNGSLKSWKEVGGPDEKILLLSRESNSGTYVFFNEHVLKKDGYSPAARLMPSNAAIVQSCQQDAWSIGYVGLAYTKDGTVKVIAVKKDAASAGVLPNLETVGNESYAIARPLQVYTRGEPKGKSKAFIDYALSAAGQQVVAETGYIPLRSAQ